MAAWEIDFPATWAAIEFHLSSFWTVPVRKDQENIFSKGTLNVFLMITGKTETLTVKPTVVFPATREKSFTSVMLWFAGWQTWMSGTLQCLIPMGLYHNLLTKAYVILYWGQQPCAVIGRFHCLQSFRCLGFMQASRTVCKCNIGTRSHLTNEHNLAQSPPWSAITANVPPSLASLHSASAAAQPPSLCTGGHTEEAAVMADSTVDCQHIPWRGLVPQVFLSVYKLATEVSGTWGPFCTNHTNKSERKE